MADDFYNFFNETVKKHSIEDGKKHRNKPSHNQRIHCHKVFKRIAMKGQCSMDWFFGFKLHLIINEKGEILNFMITPGNVDNRFPLKYENFVREIYGKLVADKGYISQELFNKLLVNGIQLVTKIKNNMKNSLMSMADKILLRKRAFSPVRTQDDKAGVPASESRH